MTTEQPEQRAEQRNRRRLAEIFGDVLPDTTTDERSPGAPHASERDDWYELNRPPHHG